MDMQNNLAPLGEEEELFSSALNLHTHPLHLLIKLWQMQIQPVKRVKGRESAMFISIVPIWRNRHPFNMWVAQNDVFWQ